MSSLIRIGIKAALIYGVYTGRHWALVVLLIMMVLADELMSGQIKQLYRPRAYAQRNTDDDDMHENPPVLD